MSKIFNKTTILAIMLIIGLGAGFVIKAENQKKLEDTEAKRQVLLEEYKDSPMRHVLKKNHTADDYFLMCCERMGMKPDECVRYLEKKKKEMKN
jgi:hypothetical protein